MSISFLTLAQSFWETLYIVFLSGFLSILLGLMLGVILFGSQKRGLYSAPLVYQVLSFVVNIGRSVPFIILMIALIPFTRLLVGTSIGINAAIVPLTIAAIPFYARIAENALAKVDGGLIEAAKAMGATRFQIIHKVLLPEARALLIQGGTLTVISLIGYSAMAGVVGGGGLGDLAIRYGYQRFDVMVMLLTVIILVALVQLVQFFGDRLARARKLIALYVVCVLLFLACIISWLPLQLKQSTLTVGITAGPMEQVLAVAQQEAKQNDNLNIKLVVFSDYVLPNSALDEGKIDANIFQHVPYLDSQIAAHGYQLVPIAKTFVYPMGFFSIKIKNIGQLREHAVVAIPNDPTNEGRALLLLAKANLITLKPNVGLLATPSDIVANPKNLQFKELDAADLPRVMPDADLVGLTNDYVANAHLTLNDALLKEGPDAPYANIIVVQKKRADDPVFQKLIRAMHSQAVVDETNKLFPNGAAIPAWTNS